MKKVFFTLFLIINFISASLSASIDQINQAIDIKTYKFTFSKNEHFMVSYADYPVGEEKFYELKYEEGALLPPEIVTHQRGLMVSGNNHSDDLFMYAYKKLEGLKPNSTYKVSFSLELASNATYESIGVGGSPGESVYVKIGVVSQPPERDIDLGNYYRMKLDKGEQSTDGQNMILIGTVGVDTQDSLYRLKTLPYQPNEEMQKKIDNYSFTTNEKGEAWLVFGTDSGYESTTTLYYTNVIATFKEIQGNA